MATPLVTVDWKRFQMTPYIIILMSQKVLLACYKSLGTASSKN